MCLRLGAGSDTDMDGWEQVEMDGFLGRKEAEEKRFGDF